MIIIIAEALLSLNKFNTPKILKDKDAIYTLLIRLILLEPGTFQSHPDMGVGIVSKYRYSFTGETTRNLRNDILNQIALYLPDLQGVDVQVSEDDGRYMIEIVIENTLYDMMFDTQAGTLDRLLSI